MKHGSLFSGIGGFDLAAEWMGWENIFHCEWNEFGQKVLNHYWPKAISYEDITKTDFSIHRGKIDILTGGFPCQPYSQAGKRLGKEDDRHLWPDMCRAIREIQPTYVVGENVAGLLSWNGGVVFNEVQTDLEAEGYEVQPVLLPACAVNAPHRRDRIWFVAYRKNVGCQEGVPEHGKGNNNEKREDSKCKEGRDRVRGVVNGCCKIQSTADTNKCTTGPSRASAETDSNRSNNDAEQEGRRQQAELNTGWGDVLRDAPNTSGRRQPIKEHGEEEPGRITKKSVPNDWENFPTQSPIRSGDDGLSDRLDGITFPKWRNESIKAYGNAIVPQVAHQIFKAIKQTT